MITIDPATGGLILSIGAQSVRLNPTDAADLADLAAEPDGTTWTQALYLDVDGSTVRTVLVHRHASQVTVAIGLGGEYTAARIPAAHLASTMRDLTAQAGTAR